MSSPVEAVTAWRLRRNAVMPIHAERGRGLHGAAMHCGLFVLFTDAELTTTTVDQLLRPGVQLCQLCRRRMELMSERSGK